MGCLPQKKCVDRCCCCVPLRPGAMAALLLTNCLTMLHVFIEPDSVRLYTYLVLVFIFITVSALAIIGLYAESSMLVLPLVVWFSIHVIILGIVDLVTLMNGTYFTEGRTDQQHAQNITTIVLNIIGYFSYFYFVIVFYSLYIDAKEKQRMIEENEDVY